VKREVIVDVVCPDCASVGRFEGEYRPELKVTCGRCGEDITREFKRVFFRGVAVDLNARMVEQENRAFLNYLDDGW